MKHNLHKWIPLILCAALLIAMLSGCAREDGEASPEMPEDTGIVDGEDHVSAAAVGDSLFSLNYYPGQSLNPYSNTSAANLLVTSLMYEGLFKIDENFDFSANLCEDYSTEDGTSYIVTIKSGLTFTDGSGLTASDVVYSLNTAMDSRLYSERLDCIASVSAQGGSEVLIELKYANQRLPALLDVPIVKYGTGREDIPVGTGPYGYSEAGEYPLLKAWEGYRDYRSLPIQRVYLREYTVEDQVAAFEGSYLDLVVFDPTGSISLGYGGSYETRYFDTTYMQYVGFNMSGALNSPEIRRAIGFAVDRDYITDTIMGGNGIIATLAMHPNSADYRKAMAAGYEYSLQKMTEILVEQEVADTNGDGFLEYNRKTISINFIVNNDNAYKVKAARKIAETLSGVGFDITLRELPWDEYTKALEKGDFDMYYAEVMLKADFDLSALLLEGGALNYGGVHDREYETLIRDYLSADEDGRGLAAVQLLKYIADTAPIVPIMFKTQAVLTHRGVVSGINPTQRNIFYNFTEWTITFD